MAHLSERVAAKRAQRALPRFGWCAAFDARYDGRYGKKRYQPIAAVREFAPGEKMPEKWEEITAEEHAALAPFAGKDLIPYESRGDFLKRMTP